jgi:hypothetical protein
MTANAKARVLQPIPATVPAVKHMLFCLPGLRHLANFIMTRKTHAVYPNFATLIT